jgi:FixJ family two-component response regulator
VSKLRDLIAVVDDEEPVRIALRRLLRSAGVDVETFSSGREFLESLKAHCPDCVVLDLNMPVLDGFAVQARITVSGLDLPVVVLTGYDTPEARERAMAGGAASYVRKPADEQKLLEAIALAMGHAPGNPGEAGADPA